MSLSLSLITCVTTGYDGFLKLPVAAADGGLSLTEIVRISGHRDKIFIMNPRDQ